jgi:hypothetical protein
VSGWHDPVTKDSARQRCRREIRSAIENHDNVLIDALPSIGKSSSIIPVARETDSPVTILTARHDLYDQYEQWCKDYQKRNDDDLEYHVLPSFLNDCPTASGDEGEGWREDVRKLYDRGVPPHEIHKRGDEVFNEPLPCVEDGGCPYQQTWDFDHEVLIGHYTHAYVHPVVAGRTVVFDEFPEDAFIEEFENPEVAVSGFLKSTDEIPFDNFTDLIENRSNQSRRDTALETLKNTPLLELRETSAVIENSQGDTHALAPHIVYTVLNYEQFGDKWESANLGHEAGVRNRESGKLRVLNPPVLTHARNVIGLDGTPSWRMWNIVLGCGVGANDLLEHNQILTDDERREYISDVLELKVIQTTANANHYSGGTWVTPDEDKALIEAVSEKHQEQHALITTNAAEQKYENVGALDSVGHYNHYGNIKGSNQYGDSRVGLVIGSQLHNYDYVEEWATLLGEHAEPDGKGMHLSFGEFGDEVLNHMRELEVAQAVMRFGRDTNGATVYVHTGALPAWMPVTETGDVSKRSAGMKQVMQALLDLEEASTDEIVDHDEVEITESQVRKHLNALDEEGTISYQKEGRGGKWRGMSLDNTNPDIRVHLP